MKPSSGRLSDYEIWTSPANHDSARSSVGNCVEESFLVGERNLLEVSERSGASISHRKSWPS